MRLSRSTYVLAAGFVATIPLAFAQCGGDDGSPTGGADASSADGTSGDSMSSADAPKDTASGTDSARDSSNDSASDSGTTDAMDAGADADDAMDAADTWDGFDGYTPGPPCDASAQCGLGECCFGNCTNVATDPHNCGSCGNACITNQFCTGLACKGAVFSNLCANPRGTVLLDPYDPDNDAGTLMGAALSANCNPGVIVTAVQQDSGVVTDPTTGRPTIGPGNTLVMAGGAYGQLTMAYLDNAGVTKLVLAADGQDTIAYFDRATNAPVVSSPLVDLTPSHDFFAIELTVEPISGTLSYTGFGMYAPGTAAVGYYFPQVVMPNIATYTDAWYIYEWTDSGDVDGGAVQLPDSTDTFTLLMSGQ